MKKLLTNIPKSSIKIAVISHFSSKELGFTNPSMEEEYDNYQESFFNEIKLLYFYIKNSKPVLEKKMVRELVDMEIKSLLFIGQGNETGQSNSKGFLITDHVNMSGLNPLRGINDEKYGVRFPDMSNTYQTDFDAHKLAELSLEKAKLLIPKNIGSLSCIEKDALKKNKELQVISEETYFGVITAKQAGCRIRSIILKEPTNINSLFT